MSTIVIIRHTDAIHWITDGLSYNASGRVMGIEQKVMVLTHLNAAIFTRGPARLSWPLSLALSQEFNSFDTMLAGLSTFMLGFAHEHETELRSVGFPDFELYITGWSTVRGRPECYLMRCGFEDSDLHHDQNEIGYRPQPFALVEITAGLAATPQFDQSELATTSFPLHLKPEALNPAIDGLHVFEIIRRTFSIRKFGLEGIRCAGGYALLTTMRCDQINQIVLQRYDDKIGELLDPAPISDWAAWRAGCSRAAVGGMKASLRSRLFG